jgi:Cu/Ag efflux protein CusF
MSRFFASAVLLAAASIVSLAASQSQALKPVVKENQVTATATIKAVDQATRSITLRTENGDEDTFTVGPDVERFSQLKAGDTIRVTYMESVVFQVGKPGVPAPTSGTVAAGGRLKDVPGGALGTQETASVTVKAVDVSVPSITVVTSDGRTITRRIADKKNLEGVKAGDRIDITFSRALIVAAESSK